MKYLLNLTSRTIHNACSVDGRCKIDLIRDENKKEFDLLEEAMNYLPEGDKPTKCCAFCFGARRKK